MRTIAFRIHRPSSIWRGCLLLLGLAGASCAVGAQPAKPGEVTTTVNANVASQLGTDIDSGGRFDWVGADVGISVTRQFTPALSIGINASYASENWSFDLPTGFGPQAPWGNVLRPSLGFNVGYNLAPDMSVFVAPQLEWSYESGASASEGQNYGAVVGVTKVFSPTLFAGVGLGVFRQIDETKYFPFFIVNWQIDERWRLSNPVQAGPAGGAGLELSYSWGNGWTLGGGAAYRDYRFRLRSDGPTPNGIGQNSGTPVFARLRYTFNPAAHIDLYAGAVVGGRLKVLDASGATLQQSDYGTSPLLALSGSISF